MFVVLKGSVVDQPARRPGPRGTSFDPRPGPFHRRGRHTLRAPRTGGRGRRRGRRDAAGATCAIACADHRRGGSRRAHRPRADPAPSRAHRSRRYRTRSDRSRRSHPMCCACRRFSSETAIRITSSTPRTTTAAAALLEQYGARQAQVLVVCPNGSVLLNPSEEALGRCLGMLDAASERRALRCRLSSVPDRRAWPPPSTRPRKACGSSCSTAGRSADRRARARASRITSAFRPASRVRHSPVAPSSRRRSSEPRS